MTTIEDKSTANISDEREFWLMSLTDTIPFFSSSKSDLECDECKDESLYHDSNAWAHTITKKLLCVNCYIKLEETEKTGFQFVITYH